MNAGGIPSVAGTALSVPSTEVDVGVVVFAGPGALRKCQAHNSLTELFVAKLR